MDVQQFWDLIDSAQEKSAGEQEQMLQALMANLQGLDTESIMLFILIFDEFLARADRARLWAAAFVINDGCSGDCFDFFRRWLIAQGKEVYLSALKDPSSLSELGGEIKGQAEFEEIYYAPMDTWCKKEGRCAQDFDAFEDELAKYSLSDEILEDIEAEVVYAEDIDEDWEEGELEQILPDLCEIFRC